MTMALVTQEPVVTAGNGDLASTKAKRFTFKAKLEVVQKKGGSIDITSVTLIVGTMSAGSS